MAIKYTKESYSEIGREAHRLHKGKVGTVYMSRKWLFMMIYLCICSLIFLSSLYDYMQKRSPDFNDQPVIEGDGLIIEKSTTDEDGDLLYVVGVKVVGEDGKELQGYMRTDRASYYRTSEGDKVEVLYQMNKGGDRILIHELTLAPIDYKKKKDSPEKLPSDSSDVIYT